MFKALEADTRQAAPAKILENRILFDLVLAIEGFLERKGQSEEGWAGENGGEKERGRERGDGVLCIIVYDP